MSCSLGYYLTPSKNCIPCTDTYCFNCNYLSLSGADICSTCLSGYGVNIYQSQLCGACSIYSLSCSSVNNCVNQANCVSCNTYLASGDQCVPCSQVFRKCMTCTTSQCLSCSTLYYLNVSANSKLHFM